MRFAVGSVWRFHFEPRALGHFETFVVVEAPSSRSDRTRVVVLDDTLIPDRVGRAFVTHAGSLRWERSVRIA